MTKSRQCCRRQARKWFD